MTLSNTATPLYYGQFRDAVVRGDIPVNREISMEMNRIDALPTEAISICSIHSSYGPSRYFAGITSSTEASTNRLLTTTEADT
jgi:hypothetical protein